jgi:hypothetical protein
VAPPADANTNLIESPEHRISRKLVFAGDAFKVLQQWSFLCIQCIETVRECGYHGGVNRDTVFDDSG